MITPSRVREVARQEQTTELNVRREYAQQLFLAYFYRLPVADRVYFKGGTALRIVFNSPRFSEDLDFSVGELGTPEIEEAILSGLREMEREGVVGEILEAKATSGGYLAEIWLGVSGEQVRVLLQFSQRSKGVVGEVVTVSSRLVLPFTIVMLEGEKLVEEKMAALLTRAKPRDYYDLYFMLRSGLVLLGEKKKLGQVKEKLAETEIDFSGELKQFLPRSHWPVIKDFRRVLQREIARFG